MTPARCRLMPEPHSVAVARATVRGYLQSAGVRETDAAVLVASELVSNAVLHPAVQKGPIEVTVDVRDQGVHIEVTDADPRPPVARSHALDDEFGRGLQIVERLADAWGWAPMRDNGKMVWCDLRADGAVPAAGGR